MSKLTTPTLTKAEAAALVRRTVPKLDKTGRPVLDENKHPVVEEASVPESEVMGYAEYDDQVVVVTTAGEKLTHLKKRPGPINPKK